MSTLERFGVSMETDLLARLDELSSKRGYSSRSEALRDLVRQELVKEEWENPEAEVVGTITIVFQHHPHELVNELLEMQHHHHDLIICSNHIHMDSNYCMEVIVVRGCSREVKHLADSLISIRGVKHGQLVCSTTGKSL